MSIGDFHYWPLNNALEILNCFCRKKKYRCCVYTVHLISQKLRFCVFFVLFCFFYSSISCFVICFHLIPALIVTSECVWITTTIEQVLDLELNYKRIQTQSRKHTLRDITTQTHTHTHTRLQCMTTSPPDFSLFVSLEPAEGWGFSRHVHTLPDPASKHPALLLLCSPSGLCVCMCVC